MCAICLSQNRDETLLCIVEEIADLWAVERAQNYRGKYHVLGGNLSAISGKTIQDLNLESLYLRLEKVQNSINQTDLILNLVILLLKKCI